MNVYTFDKDFFVESEIEALNKMYCFNNNIIQFILENFEKSNLEILIGGSTSLASIVKDKYKFTPQDIDIYIKNIDNDKIKIIDEILQLLFEKNKYIIYIVRRCLTLTWWIFDKNENFIIQIQLNLLITKSWTEIFLVYPSDLLCIGYEIQTKKFITLQYRWNSINTLNEPIFFTNIFCYDNGTIHNLTNKYGNRNFITALAIEKNNKH